MSLLNLILKITADGAQAETALKKVGSQAESVGKTITNAFTVGVVGLYVKSVIQASDATVDMSEAMGVTVEQMIRLRKASIEAGTDVAKFQGIFQKLNEARKKASEGDQETQDSFGAFKISLDNVNKAGYETYDLIMDLQKALTDLGRLTPAQETMLSNLIGAKGAKTWTSIKSIQSGEGGSWLSGSLSEQADATKSVGTIGQLWDDFTEATSTFTRRVVYGYKLIWDSMEDIVLGRETGSKLKERQRDEAEAKAAREKALKEEVKMWEDKKAQDESARANAAQFREAAANSANREKLQAQYDSDEAKREMESARTPADKLRLLASQKRGIMANRYDGLEDPDMFDAFRGDSDAAALNKIRNIDAQMANIRHSRASSSKRGAVSSLAATGNMIFGGAAKDPVPILEKIETNTRQYSITRRSSIDSSIPN